MTPKEWLQRGRNIDCEIKALEEQKEIIFAQITKCTSATDGEKVKGSCQNAHENKLVKYVDTCNDINKLIAHLILTKQEIISAINKVKDSTLRTLLYERYINYKPWYKIANIISYSESHIKHTLHCEALNEISKII